VLLYSPVGIHIYFWGSFCLHLQGWRVIQTWIQQARNKAYSSTLKMEAVCSSETVMDFTWCLILKNSNAFHNRCCEFC
jgi:hypothetical protein